MAKHEALEASWPGRVSHALVEAIPKSEAQQAGWHRYVFKAPIEVIIEDEALLAIMSRCVVEGWRHGIPTPEGVKTPLAATATDVVTPLVAAEASLRILGQALSGWGLVPEVAAPMQAP